MKSFAIVLGLGCLLFIGVAVLASSVKYMPWTRPGQENEYREAKALLKSKAVSKDAELRPELTCESTEFNFGVMPPHAPNSHVFKIVNSGAAPLIIRDQGSSCNCTRNELSVEKIEPGESFDMEVSWTTQASGKFVKYVTVGTNDASQPSEYFFIEGTVHETLCSDSPLISLKGVPDEEMTAEFKIFSDVWDDFVVAAIESSVETVKVEAGELQQVGNRVERAFKVVVDPESDVSGTKHAMVRLRIKPPASVTEKGELNPSEFIGRCTIADGLLVFDIPVEVTFTRRVNLYGKSITESGDIDLGKLVIGKSTEASWSIVGKIRGDKLPEGVRVEFEGIPGIDAMVDYDKEKDPLSFRIQIRSEDGLKRGVYDQFKSGKLRLFTPGLSGQSELEFNVFLDVVEKD